MIKFEQIFGVYGAVMIETIYCPNCGKSNNIINYSLNNGKSYNPKLGNKPKNGLWSDHFCKSCCCNFRMRLSCESFD